VETTEILSIINTEPRNGKLEIRTELFSIIATKKAKINVRE